MGKTRSIRATARAAEVRRRAGGFTLVEVLVALFVFSVIAAAAIAIMRITITSKEAIDQASARIRALQLAHSLMKADFAQLVSRPVRDGFGNLEPAFAGGAFAPDDARVALTRGGWTNPGGGAARPSLQRVEYAFADGALIRRIRTHLDLGANAEPREARLLEGLADLDIAFLTTAGRWVEDFRAAAAGAGGGEFPVAIRVTAAFGDGAPYEMLFLTPETLR